MCIALQSKLLSKTFFSSSGSAVFTFLIKCRRGFPFMEAAFLSFFSLSLNLFHLSRSPSPQKFVSCNKYPHKCYITVLMLPEASKRVNEWKKMSFFRVFSLCFHKYFRLPLYFSRTQLWPEFALSLTRFLPSRCHIEKKNISSVLFMQVSILECVCPKNAREWRFSFYASIQKCLC